MLETLVNRHDFYLLNLWRILSGGGCSSHTVKLEDPSILQPRL